MGSILKNNLVDGLGPKLTRLNLADIREEAALILQRAGEQAERIRADANAYTQEAQEQAQVLHQQAREQGYQEGLSQGLADGKAQGQVDGLAEARQEYQQQSLELRTTLEKVLHSFDTQRDHLMAQARQDLLTLSMAIATKVIHRQIELDPEIMRDTVKAAINLVSSRSMVVLKMNPADVERFKLLDEKQARIMFGLQHLKVVEDSSMEPGGCVVETENGNVDAQLQTQLGNLMHQLTPGMEETVTRWANPMETTQ